MTNKLSSKQALMFLFNVIQHFIYVSCLSSVPIKTKITKFSWQKLYAADSLARRIVVKQTQA